MKSLCLIFSLFISITFLAQSIKVKEKNADFSAAQNVNALNVDIPYASQDYVDGKLKKFFKGLGKHKESKNEHSALMVELKEMGKIPFNAYAYALSSNNDIVTVTFGFDLGGAYLNSKEHPEKFKVIESMLEGFASNTVSNWVEGVVRDEKKVLSDLEKQQKDLVKRKEQLEKEIKDFEKKIEKNKAEIKENLENQSLKKGEVETQKKTVSLVEKQLKELR
jgi:translation initiation factor 2B subunit (eIF-2B alpha/beta/delta family)